MKGGATIEGDHRYHLWRRWEDGTSSVCWVMLNPSTADATNPDPTVTKCIGYARRWGYGAIDVINLYTLRTKSPQILKEAGYPNGERADWMITHVLSRAIGRVILGWGTKAERSRPLEVLRMIRDAGHTPMALRVTNGGHPQHPLYLPYDQQLVPFEAA